MTELNRGNEEEDSAPFPDEEQDTNIKMKSVLSLGSAPPGQQCPACPVCPGQVKAPVFSLVGNGWCLNNQLVGNHRIGIKGNWASSPTYKKNGADAAKSCETRCDQDAGCIGYLTEDGSKCQIIPGTTYGSSVPPGDTITGVDHETRNYCWRKGKGTGWSDKHPGKPRAGSTC